uniref:Reverse transcriptase n=1 Tax=Steinernema glaseri TaxID=37863 RepID=A0A1I7Z9N4_9BILA
MRPKITWNSAVVDEIIGCITSYLSSSIISGTTWIVITGHTSLRSAFSAFLEYAKSVLKLTGTSPKKTEKRSNGRARKKGRKEMDIRGGARTYHPPTDNLTHERSSVRLRLVLSTFHFITFFGQAAQFIAYLRSNRSKEVIGGEKGMSSDSRMWFIVRPIETKKSASGAKKKTLEVEKEILRINSTKKKLLLDFKELLAVENQIRDICYKYIR